jgi:betaine-aldehyde dehydrogenase
MTQVTVERSAPSNGQVVSIVPVALADEVEAAVAAARRAFDAGPWPRATGLERAGLLNRVADAMQARAEHLARLDAEEAGKPLRLARADIEGAISLTRYAASLAINLHGTTYTNFGEDFTGLVLREPAGVVGLIIPWNFPALILCQKLPFALAAGCTVVAKPSELTSGSAVEIAQLYADAGLPAGVLNLVLGDGRTGQLIAEHKAVDVLSFTGSTATGRKVLDAAKSNIKKLSLELGGKAANIIFADADLDAAANGAVFGAFFNNGECCVSQARLLVQESVADEILAMVTAKTEKLRVGNPLEDNTDLGPLISTAHLDKVMSYVNRGRAEGAEIIFGGERLHGATYDRGLYVKPTVLAKTRETMSVFREEIFGPVVSVTTFRDMADAARLANAVDYGLANSIWSKDIDKVLPLVKQLRSGTVYVNTVIDAPPVMPFGGYKLSGFGREMGEEGFNEFTQLKAVNIRTSRSEFPLSTTTSRVMAHEVG